jgi:hypothetical protein
MAVFFPANDFAVVFFAVVLFAFFAEPAFWEKEFFAAALGVPEFFSPERLEAGFREMARTPFFFCTE